MKITALLLVLAAVLVLAGCKGLQDVTAWITGAPSNAEIDAERTKLQDAERKAKELGILEQQHRETVANLTVTADGAEERKIQVRSLYARMAAELANLTGAAADALVLTMAGLQRQLVAIDAEHDAAADLAAAYEAEANKLTAARRQAAIEIAEANANLDGMEDATAEAINSTLAFIGLAGETAASLGVPGAREAASTVTKIGTGLLGLALTAGTGGMGFLARRRRLRAEKAESRADNLGRVVSAVERFDLINLSPGPELETAKEGAKEWAGDVAHHELKATLLANGNLAAA